MTVINASFASAKAPSKPVNEFKSAFRQLAGGVSVVAVDDGHQRTGFTATSVSSLSADPPSLIVCVNSSSSTFRILKPGLSFSVNVLDATQRHIAERFAGRGGIKGPDRFLGATWLRGDFGAPLLNNALAAIECQVEEMVVRHSHAIIIGRILAAHANEGDTALVYWRGDYSTHSSFAEPESGSTPARRAF